MTADPDPYLLGLVLADRPVLVVGAGTVAGRRIGRLIGSGARITVVAPQAADEVRRRSEVGQLHWRRRPYADADLDGVWFVLAASDDPQVNAAVADGAERRRVFCVRADEASGGSARTPATVSEGGVLLGVLTRHVAGHGDPSRIRRLRDGLADRLRELLAEPRAEP